MSTIPSSSFALSAAPAWDYGGSGATTSATSTASTSSPVASGATLGQAQSASAIALDAGVVATLGGTTFGTTTYTATGLLDSFVSAGTLATPGGTTGTTATGSVDVNAQWASVLQGNAGYSTNVAADLYDQGVVSTLSVSA